jgi:hypothetical protein
MRNKCAAFTRLFLLVAIGCVAADGVAQQVFPPGSFSIDGIPVSCGANYTIVSPQVNDTGKNDLQGHIYLNPILIAQLPTPLKLFTYAHECGHSFVGASESAADCWAIRTGRQQGWFRLQDFADLQRMFANNPGDWTHFPGPVRVRSMWGCYTSP